MAKLKQHSPVKLQVSDDSDFGLSQTVTAKDASWNRPSAKTRSSPRKKDMKHYYGDGLSCSDDQRSTPSSTTKVKANTPSRRKQIRLAPLQELSKSRPLQFDVARAKRSPTKKVPDAPSNAPSVGGRGSIERPEATNASSATQQAELSDSSITIEVEESVWCGSEATSEDSDEELPSPRKLFQFPPRVPSSQLREPVPINGRSVHQAQAEKAHDSSILNQKLASTTLASSTPPSSSDKENDGAFLRFSPPRLHSRPDWRQEDRPVTPPQSPSKSRLQSPSKTRIRAPTPTMRQSLDSFWNSNAVNDWNDQYSPQKVLKSPKKLKFLRDDASTSPSGSPRKVQSSSKATKAERDAKKDFEARKRDLAEEFLQQLDETVTGGQIRTLSASTGGVHFIWSKTLNSTAGRANWRKETTKTRNPDNNTTTTTYKHHASIELAEKVIDDENRLLNVIAHEFCHLANFMISGIKTHPHGSSFKAWGRKTTQAFAHRGVEVTTKHSYQIEYKYVWQCSNEDCAVEFKRHSKSIDPKRHTCGSCRSKLVQIKPAPRKDAAAGVTMGYAKFVKENFAEVKRGMSGASQKEVMEAVGRKYRTEKAKKDDAAAEQGSQKKQDRGQELKEVIGGLEVIRLDDD